MSTGGGGSGNEANNQLLQCTPHMESGLHPLPIYYNVYIMIQSTLWSHGSPSLSLSISCTPSPSPSLPLRLPSPLPLCGVDSLPCQYTYWRVAVAIISSSLFIAILHTSELCSHIFHAISLATSSYNVIKQCLSILLCSRLLSRVLLVNYNTLYMYIQTYILHVHCVYGVHASKRLDLLLLAHRLDNTDA